MLKQGIFDSGPNPFKRGGPTLEDIVDSPERIVLAAKGFKLFDGSWDIAVKEGNVTIESAFREGEMLLAQNGIYLEAIKVIAGDEGCVLEARQNLPRKVY